MIIPPLERRQGGKATEHNVNKCIQVSYSRGDGLGWGLEN